MAVLEHSRTPDILAARGGEVTRILRGLISNGEDRCNVVRIKSGTADDRSRFAKHLLQEALFYYERPLILFANVAGDDSATAVFDHLQSDLGMARTWSWEQPQHVPPDLVGDQTQAATPAPGHVFAKMAKRLPLIGAALKPGKVAGAKGDPIETCHSLFRRLRQIAAARDVVLVLENAHHLPIIHAANVAQMARTLPVRMRMILMTAGPALGSAPHYETIAGAVLDLAEAPAPAAAIAPRSTPPVKAAIPDMATVDLVGRVKVHVKDGGVMLGAITNDRRPDQAVSGLAHA